MPPAEKTAMLTGLRGETDSSLHKQVLWSMAAWLAFSVLPAGGAAMLLDEHFRRTAILESGARLDAKVVTRRVGKARFGQVCRTVYEFAWAGRTHISDVVGCPDDQPVGGRMEIAFDPADPAGSFALSQGPWAGGAKVFPFVLLAAFAALTWFLVGSALRAIAELHRRRQIG